MVELYCLLSLSVLRIIIKIQTTETPGGISYGRLRLSPLFKSLIIKQTDLVL